MSKIMAFTVFYLQENTYAEHTEVCVSLQDVRSTHPSPSFFRLWIRKKLKSYIHCPSNSFLHKCGNTQIGMDRAQDINKSHQKF